MPRAYNEQESLYIRSELMNAAAKLFAEKGIKKTSIDKIIADVGIAKGTFYNFFDSKEDLFIALMESAQKDFKEQILRTVQKSIDLDPASRLKMAFAASVESWIQNPLSTMLNNEVLEKELRRLPSEKIQEYLRDDALFSEQLLGICSLAGVESQKDPEIVAGLLRSVFLVSMHEDRFPEEYFEAIIDILFSMVADYIAGNEKEPPEKGGNR